MTAPVTLAEAASRLTLTVPEAASMIGISRDAGYRAALAGQIPTVRLGRRVLVPTAAFLAMLGHPAPELGTGPEAA